MCITLILFFYGHDFSCLVLSVSEVPFLRYKFMA